MRPGTTELGRIPSRPVPWRGQVRRRNLLRALVPWVFLAPALLFFLYFKFVPMARGIQLSFYKVGFLGDSTWVGLQNYQRAFANTHLHAAFWHTFAYVAVTVLVSALLAFFLALVLEGPARHLQILRTATFLPVVTSVAVVAEVWRILLAPTERGVANSLLGLAGLGPYGFFADPGLSLASIMAMTIWKSIPYDMVIFVAGLAAVNRELYAAASIDGANVFQRIRYVTIPSITSTFTIILILGIIRGFRVFAEVYITTGGGPARSSEVIMTHIYKAGFNQFDYGYASAVSSLLFVLTATLTSLYFLWSRRHQ